MHTQKCEYIFSSSTKIDDGADTFPQLLPGTASFSTFFTIIPSPKIKYRGHLCCFAINPRWLHAFIYSVTRIVSVRETVDCQLLWGIRKRAAKAIKLLVEALQVQQLLAQPAALLLIHDADANPRLDPEGHMQDNQRQRLEGLQKVLAAKALPNLNAERASVLGTTQAPLQWNSSDIAANSTDSRDMVMTYILQEIGWWTESRSVIIVTINSLFNKFWVGAC
jgi:hypothetical protein